ncbi:DUF4397 domain-containing protein [Pedobacter insulae]|uniref:DUF4397 domain-containing protein n=1 Tax=Pedobacter insulae TaxID=414048 RepID=A0A1I2T978_9SPHI|nr:DUF4397 domain-containing protein [Pedobacter insulae]SFG61563.1 protein of unknown function [Pedobacter insulae]
MAYRIPTRLFSFFVLFSFVAFNACKKADNPPNADGAYIRFINTSPTLGTYNIYFDDKIVNTMAVPFGGTVSYKPYVAGSYSVKYTTATNPESILTKQISLASKKIYSLYLVDKDDKLDALLVTDDASATSTTKAFVKFINLSPDAPALGLDIAQGASLFTNKTYKTGTEFVEVDAKAYTFEIMDSGSGTLKASLPELTLAAGRYYTIIARGMINPGPNDQGFGAQSIINQ